MHCVNPWNEFSAGKALAHSRYSPMKALLLALALALCACAKEPQSERRTIGVDQAQVAQAGVADNLAAAQDANAEAALALGEAQGATGAIEVALDNIQQMLDVLLGGQSQ